jgi:hypothetical protein
MHRQGLVVDEEVEDTRPERAGLCSCCCIRKG